MLQNAPKPKGTHIFYTVTKVTMIKGWIQISRSSDKHDCGRQRGIITDQKLSRPKLTR